MDSHIYFFALLMKKKNHCIKKAIEPNAQAYPLLHGQGDVIDV